MTVPYTSYEAIVIQCVITMLSKSTTFWAVTGAANQAAALNFIIEGDGGDDVECNGSDHSIATNNATINRATASAWAHVADRPTDHPSEPLTFSTWRRQGVIAVRLWLRRVGTDTPPERLRRVLNAVGSIRADLEAQFGAAGCLPAGGIDSRVDSLPDESSATRGLACATLTIHWKDIV